MSGPLAEQQRMRSCLQLSTEADRDYKSAPISTRNTCSFFVLCEALRTWSLLSGQHRSVETAAQIRLSVITCTARTGQHML